jgi:bla regulator protein blaR1
MTALGQSNFLQALGWAVLNSLWQIALLWVVYQLITGLIRPISSAKKSSLATILLISGFAWFLFTFFSILLDDSSKGGIIVSSGMLDMGTNEELNLWLSKTLPAASIAYLVLLVLPILHFGKNYRYVQLIRCYGLTKIDVEWRIFIKKVAVQMGIAKNVGIWISEYVSSPVTIGFLKPVILVPLAAINHLNPSQLEAVLLHELSHIRRFDYLINLVMNFIRTILYFNPFVKAFVRTVEREREKSCDEMVMQFQYDPHAYASALLTLEKASSELIPLVLPATGRKNELLKRIEIILGINKGPVISFNRLAGLFAGLLCFIGLNAILILTRPVNGERNMAVAHIMSPFYFVTDNTGLTRELVPENTEVKTTEISNHLPKARLASITAKKVSKESTNSSALANGFLQVSYEPAATPVAVELKDYEIEQVERAMDASKRVLQEAQWKMAEKGLADAFTHNEKEQLRKVYLQGLEKYDWKKWENKLKSAYDKIDWDRINFQLDNAITQIKLDSLRKLYSNVALDLAKLQEALAKNDLKGIPDTDMKPKQTR